MWFTGILGVVKFYHFCSGLPLTATKAARGKQNVKSEVNRGLKTSIV